MTNNCNLFKLAMVMGVLFLLPGCGEMESLTPEQRLERIEMGFPSVLGYVRIQPEVAGALLSLEDMLRLPNLNSMNPTMSVGDLVLPFMDRICLLCRPGTAIHMILVDPKIFGGLFALHFETEDKGKFVEFLEEDPHYKRIPNSDPPEFAWDEESGWMLRIAGMLDALGIRSPALGRAPFLRVIVQETERGTLVMPSHDLKWDFMSFLEGTNNLAHWGDAAFVMHIETGRLAKAFSKTLEEYKVSLSGLLDKAERMTGEQAKSFSAVFRAGQAIPSLLLDSTRCLAGYRFVSESPVTHAPELCLKAAEDCALERFFHCFRPDRLDLVDLVPEGSILQWNFDPDALAQFLNEEITSLAELLGMETRLVEENLPQIVDAASDEAGRYLVGLSPDKASSTLAFITGLKETASLNEPKQTDTLHFWKPLADVAFANGELVRKPHETDERIERTEVITDNRITRFSYESATVDNFRITTIPWFGGGDDLTMKILKRIDSKAEMDDTECESADLLLRIDLSALSDILFPGIENMIPLTIMGKGTVEGNRMTIRFTH